MKKMIRLFCVACSLLLLTMTTGCSSSGDSSGSTQFYGASWDGVNYGDPWDYDGYYRDGVNDDYRENAAAAAAVRARNQGGGLGGGGLGGGGLGGGGFGGGGFGGGGGGRR